MSTSSGTSQDRNPVEALADDFLRRRTRRRAAHPRGILPPPPRVGRRHSRGLPGPDPDGGPPLRRPRRLHRRNGRSHTNPAGGLGDYRILARSAAAAWASSTRPSKSRSVDALLSRSCPMRRSPTPSKFYGFSGKARRPRGCTIPISCQSSAWAGMRGTTIMSCSSSPVWAWTPSWRSCGDCDGAREPPARRTGQFRGDPSARQ